MKIVKIKEKYLKILFVAIMFVVCVLWAVYQPFNEGPDERMKMDICQYILEHNNTLPTGEEKEIINPIWGISYGFTPILSYMLSALFVKIAMIFTTNATVLLVAARFTSILCYTGTIIMVIKIAEQLFKNKIFKWLFIIFVSCLPQFVFLGTYLNNDSLAILSSSIIVYSWIIGLKNNWDMNSNILLGMGVGICALSYYNCYGFILTSIIIYMVSCYMKKTKFKEFLKKAIAISIIALLIAGWWFIRSAIIHNGDFIGMRTSDKCAEKYAQEDYKPSKRKTPSKQGHSLMHMFTKMGWINQTTRSFIGVFGHMRQPMPFIVYLGYIVLFLIGIIGIIYYWVIKIRHKEHKKDRYLVLLQTIFGINIIIPIILSIYYSYCSDFQPQGRYIMPMLIPFMYFVTLGMESLTEKVIRREKIKNILIITLTVLLFIVPIICLFKYVILKY